ncbi:MAG: SMU1112c/YaeR family gloxylase I-like metalloprotein [Cognatishimia sp.]
MQIEGVHHAAIICSDIHVSKAFYSDVLGLKIIAETYREVRDSWKVDFALSDGSQIELFSMPNAPTRPSYPEAQGLRHLALKVLDVAQAKHDLEEQGVAVEPIRIDALTGKAFTFFADPDGLPLELYQI